MMDVSWYRSLFRRTLIAILGASFGMGILAVARAMAPDWAAGYVPFVLFFVAWEAVYTTDQLAGPDWRWRRTLSFRLAELLVMILIIRFITLGVQGRVPDLGRWFRNPGAFFDGEFVGVSIIAFVTWILAAVSARDFAELALRPEELAERPRSSREMTWADAPARPPQRTEILAGFSERWLWIGFFLVILAALSRFVAGGLLRGVISLANMGLPGDMVLALVAYFLGGLLLLSQGRLAVLRGRWLMQQTQGVATVSARWPRYALAVVLGVAILAVLLPLGSTWQLGHWLEAAIYFLLQIFLYIFAFLIGIFGAFLSLFGGGTDEESSQQTAPAAFPPPVPSENRSLLPDWFGSLVFWVVVVAIVNYALTSYLSGRVIYLTRIVAAVRDWLAVAWLWLRRRTNATMSQARAILARLTRTEITPPSPIAPWRFLRLGALSPRERVRFFYLAALRRAAEQGVKRPPAATPLEHVPALDASWPEAETELEYLTAEFVKARYTAEPIEATEAGGVQKIWERVKTVWRARKQAKS
ncbi:MAG: DUF4129 domain-containing protein [Anaerolineae bacterium]|nr:DUF4129 domain-containing protein [Anaerolineae bacterium]